MSHNYVILLAPTGKQISAVLSIASAVNYQYIISFIFWFASVKKLGRLGSEAASRSFFRSSTAQ